MCSVLLTKIMRAAASPNPGGQQCFSASPTIASKPVGFGMRASSPGGHPMQCQGPVLASQGMTSPTALQAVQQPVQQLVQVGNATLHAANNVCPANSPWACSHRRQLECNCKPVAPQPYDALHAAACNPDGATTNDATSNYATTSHATTSDATTNYATTDDATTNYATTSHATTSDAINQLCNNRRCNNQLCQQPSMQQPAMQQPTMQPQAYHPALQQEMQPAMPLSMQQPLLSHDMIQPTMQPMPPMQPMQPTVQPLQQALQQVSPAPQSQQVVMQPTVQWGQGALQQPMPQAMQPHLDQPELAFMQAPQAPATATAAYPEYEWLGWFFGPRDGWKQQERGGKHLSKWRKQKDVAVRALLHANLGRNWQRLFLSHGGHQSTGCKFPLHWSKSEG